MNTFDKENNDSKESQDNNENHEHKNEGESGNVIPQNDNSTGESRNIIPQNNASTGESGNIIPQNNASTNDASTNDTSTNDTNTNDTSTHENMDTKDTTLQQDSTENNAEAPSQDNLNTQGDNENNAEAPSQDNLNTQGDNENNANLETKNNEFNNDRNASNGEFNRDSNTRYGGYSHGKDNRGDGFSRDRDNRGGGGGFGRDRNAPRLSLRDIVKELDKTLLKMYVKRYNIIQRIKGDSGRLNPREEKEIRTSWELEAVKLSKDVRLTRHLFTLIQDIEFLPRPVAGEEKQEAFNLAPTQRPINLKYTAPIDSDLIRFYLSLAANSGAPCYIQNSALNDKTIEFIKMYNQVGTALAWDADGTLIARDGGGITLADKVIYVGADLLNFYLLFWKYIGYVSKAKFTAAGGLKLIDVSTLKKILPQLGARLSNVIPQSTSLPIRIECSGDLPDQINVPAEFHTESVIGLILAACFWEKPISIDISAHAAKDYVIERACGVLHACKANLTINNYNIHFIPCSDENPLQVPSEPALDMDLTLAAYLLALPLSNKGEVYLNGIWPVCNEANEVINLLSSAGFKLTIDKKGIKSLLRKTQPTLTIDASNLSEQLLPLGIALACSSAKNSNQTHLLNIPESTDMNMVDSFLTQLNLRIDEKGLLRTVQNYYKIPAEQDTRYNTRPSYSARSAPTEQGANQSVSAELSTPTEQGVSAEQSTPTEQGVSAEQSTSAIQNEGTVQNESTGRSASTENNASGEQSTNPESSTHNSPNFRDRDNANRGQSSPSTFAKINANNMAWTAPNAEWCMAYALIAFARPSLKLANPGIMTELYPAFWTLYNSLPDPTQKIVEKIDIEQEKPVRRRIVAYEATPLTED